MNCVQTFVTISIASCVSICATALRHALRHVLRHVLRHRANQESSLKVFPIFDEEEKWPKLNFIAKNFSTF
jgi:hypothetical protein